MSSCTRRRHITRYLAHASDVNDTYGIRSLLEDRETATTAMTVITARMTTYVG